jgi:hypothetical protein
MSRQPSTINVELEVDGRDRRAAPRFEECLPYTAALNFSAPSSGRACGAPKIVGHTRDMSEGGLALIVPSLTFAYRHLLSPAFKLRLTLELPSGPVEIEGVPTHDRPLGDSDADMHYMLSGDLDAVGGALFYGYGNDPKDSACILGLKITAMSEADRARYGEHLRLLGAKNSATASGARANGAAKTAGTRAAPKKTVVDFWMQNRGAASGHGYF